MVSPSRPAVLAPALLAAALLVSGCTYTPGASSGTFQDSVSTFWQVAKLVGKLEAYTETAPSPGALDGLLGTRDLLDGIVRNVSAMEESRAKRDLVNATSALRSAMNGSALLLESALRGNDTSGALRLLEEARANYTEAQRFAANVTDPELRAAVDFEPVLAVIDRTAAGLRASNTTEDFK